MIQNEAAADLWPPSRLDGKAWWPTSTSVASVEKRLAGLYPGVHPVVFSSARAGLAVLVEAIGLGRADLVWLPRFSSHCVIDAIGRTATPTPVLQSKDVRAALVHHQWGYPHSASAPPTARIIEDSADTLHVPGSRLCALGGEYEIVSLPKVLGCLTGGVVFCRDEQASGRLAESRDKRRSPVRVQFLAKLAGRWSAQARAYWAGAECANARLPPMGLRDIMLGLDRIDRIIADRRAKLDVVGALKPGWLRSSELRLPSNLPMEHDDRLLQRLAGEGLRLEVRHFNVDQSGDDSAWRRVIRVPLHQGVPVAMLERIASIASKWTHC